MNSSRSVLLMLCTLIVLLGLCVALFSILWAGAAPPAITVVSVRGNPVTLYGVGVYRYNPLMSGAGYAAQDFVLIGALVCLGSAAIAFLPGIDRALIPCLGALGYLSYAYASMALGAAFDWAYPAYTALFSVCGFALWFAARNAIQVLVSPDPPRRGLAAFIAFAGVCTFAIWAAQLGADLLAGRAPARLDTQMTSVTTTLDLGLIVPLCLIAAGLTWRGQVMGHVIAFPLLGCLLGLFPWIIVATMFQVRAGIVFTTAEIIGPIASFASLGLGAAWFLHDAWRGAVVSRSKHGLPDMERR
jgi:hypothetical protein